MIALHTEHLISCGRVNRVKQVDLIIELCDHLEGTD